MRRKMAQNAYRRSGRLPIRTSDPHTPSVMRYQAALRPDLGVWGSLVRIQSPRPASTGHLGVRTSQGKMARGRWRGDGRKSRPGCRRASLLALARRSRRSIFFAALIGVADPGQPRLERAGRGRHHLSRQQWRPRRPRPAGRGAGPRLAAAASRSRDFADADPRCPLDRVRRGRAAGLSRDPDAGATSRSRTAAVGADRRRAGDACRMGRATRPTPPAQSASRPEQYRRLWAVDPRRIRARPDGKPIRIDHPGYGPARRLLPRRRQGQRDPHLQPVGRRPAPRWPGSRRRCGRRSSRAWCGGIGERRSEHVAAEIGILGDAGELLLRRMRRRSTSVSPLRSSAVKLTSSSSFSITVCSRRAPIFSSASFTSAAIRASAAMPSSAKSIVTPSVASSA